MSPEKEGQKATGWAGGDKEKPNAKDRYSSKKKKTV